MTEKVNREEEDGGSRRRLFSIECNTDYTYHILRGSYSSNYYASRNKSKRGREQTHREKTLHPAPVQLSSVLDFLLFDMRFS